MGITEITAIEAVESLASGKFNWCDAEGGVGWKDGASNIPTDSEIQTEITRLQAVYDSQAYARSRKSAYDLLNQDEMRYDDLVNSTTTWPDAIAAIKLEFPK